MRLPHSALGLAAVLICTAAFAASDAERAREPSRPTKGALPDPDLLDGSTLKPEKRADHGMLGEFEIPGGDDKNSDKVGPQSDKPGGSGPQMQEQGKDETKGGGGQEKDKSAQNGGGGGQQQADSKSGQGGSGGQQSAAASKAGGGGGPAASASQNSRSAGGGGTGAQNDPNAKAEGRQVGQLNGSGESGADGGQNPGAVQKPSVVALGDEAMKIKPSAAEQAAVGAQSAGSTQQMEKQIGSGTGATGGGNSRGGGGGVEKGQTMPKGL